MKEAHALLVSAAQSKVYSAYFFLGIMYLEGVNDVVKDYERGLECLYKGAAGNNAYCYYYLAMLHAEGKIVSRDPKLEFLYLKRAAEEGFV